VRAHGQSRVLLAASGMAVGALLSLLAIAAIRFVPGMILKDKAPIAAEPK